MNHTATVKGGLPIRPVLFCGKIREAEKRALTALGYTVLTLPPYSALTPPTNRHPDMLLSRLLDGKWLMPYDYFCEHSAFFAEFRSLIVTADDGLLSHYPDDTVYNAFAIGGILYGGERTSHVLKHSYPSFCKIRQGYAHCSAAIVGNGVITADRGLYHALLQNGVDTLLIRAGHIALPPYDTGFIGGASVTLSDTLTVFFGRLEDHPDYSAMKDFAKDRHTTLLSLSNEPLSDFGGGCLIYE